MPFSFSIGKSYECDLHKVFVALGAGDARTLCWPTFRSIKVFNVNMDHQNKTDKFIKRRIALFFLSYAFFCFVVFVVSGMVSDVGGTMTSVVIAIAFTTIGIFVGFLVKGGKQNPFFLAFAISWVILFLSGIIFSYFSHIFELNL
jgi:hypothetical protein